MDDLSKPLGVVGLSRKQPRKCVKCVRVWEGEGHDQRDMERGGNGSHARAHTEVWHYESWRLLCLTCDVFWSSQRASGERPGESSSEEPQRRSMGARREATSAWTQIIKTAKNRQGQTAEGRSDGCRWSYLSTAGCCCCFTGMFDLHRAESYTSRDCH